MIDLRILKKHKITAEDWQQKLENLTMVARTKIETKPTGKKVKVTAKVAPPDTQADKLSKFVERMKSRVQEAINTNIQNFRTLYALDLLWSTPFRQVTPTLLASIVDRYSNDSEGLTNALKSFNFDISSVIVETTQIDPKTHQPIKAVSVPAFFNVMVPLVRAYMTSRRGKIVNDRNLDPFIPFAPAFDNEEYRTKTDMVSQRVELMNKQYDYLEVLNQSVLHMLLYSNAMTFTKEAWHWEEQIRYDKKNKEETYTVREGLRYHIPHPSRAFWDRSHPVKTLLNDTGCSFAGHWLILRYGEILDNPSFYNKDRISPGSSTWWSSASTFFNSVYNSCVIATPTITPPGELQSTDRETWLAENPYYSAAMSDKSVVVCEYRERFIPSEHGMGDYNHPIWGRFVLAGDGTIVYAEPIPYTPVLPMKDNGDEKLMEEASQALQLAPFQDMLGNLLTQYIYAVKQNLTNITMLDENVLDKKVMDKIKNLGTALYTGVNIVGFDGKKLIKAQNAVTQAMYSHRFPQIDVNAIITAMRLVIDLAERVLQFSSQEVSQSATHEQTKAEVNIIHGFNSNQGDYTGINVDRWMQAMGQQQYDAWMNYGDATFAAELPLDNKLTKDELAAMGITITRQAKPGFKERTKVEVKTARMDLESFAFTRDTRTRVQDVEAAQMLATFVRDLMSNPITAQAIGPEQAIMLANQIAKLGGLHLEKKLVFTGKTPEQQQQESQAMLQQVTTQVLSEVKKGMVPIMQGLQEATKKADAAGATAQQAMQLIQQIVQSAGGTGNPNPINNVTPTGSPTSTGVVGAA